MKSPVRTSRTCKSSCIAISLVLISVGVVHGFLPNSFTFPGCVLPCRAKRRVSPRLFFEDNSNNEISDEDLLKQVPKSQLVDLCAQYDLSPKGTKQVLLERLRAFANEQAERERQNLVDRVERVESGGSSDKERYEIVNDYPEDDNDEGYFCFQLPTAKNETSSSNTTTAKTETPKKKDSSKTFYPIDYETNEKGERVKTIYSTTVQNDLTGVASAQPGQSFSDNALLSGDLSATPSGSSAPWDISNNKKSVTSTELDQAKETVSELVQALLAMTGAPAFREEFIDGSPLGGKLSMSSPEGFVGFNPSQVPTEILEASSKALRANRGQVLQDVLRDYELRAVGHDGMAGDDVERGGGHYREVNKVRAFLEGYRRAQVRNVARTTITMLLDNIVTDGVEGLDMTLASMTRSSDDTNEAGELNDSLLDYLNDAIRQQEKKLEQTMVTTMKEEQEKPIPVEVDKTATLWNVTNVKGERIETLDPNDPQVKQVMKEEFEKSQQSVPEPQQKTPPEQLLLLLKLLRDRIRAEAAVANDENGRNLRVLAHCLHVSTDLERERMLMKEMGTSLSRLEAFCELVQSSIEYAESTSHQLQPAAKMGRLDLNKLHEIHDVAETLREKQSAKAGTPLPDTTF